MVGNTDRPCIRNSAPAILRLLKRQSFPRDPVGGTFVAEQFSPAAGARATTLILSIGDGARACDDVDAVAAREGTGPTAHHVVAAAMALDRQHLRSNAVEARQQCAVLAMGG